MSNRLPTCSLLRTHHSQETLLQVVVCEKANEIPVAQALLPCLPVDGRIITADAAHTQHEVVYLITPLTTLEASPHRLLELVRGHWSSENSSHYVRDVTFVKIVLNCALVTPSDPRDIPQSCHHAYSSSGIFSDCCFQTPLCFSSSRSFSFTASKKIHLAIIHKPRRLFLAVPVP